MFDLDPTIFDGLPDGIIQDEHLIIPGLEPMPLDSEGWMEWAPRQLAHRERVARACARDISARRTYEALCKQPFGIGQIYFAVTFAWIYEPRDDDDSSMAPMIIYPRQALLLIAIDLMMRREKSNLSSMAVPKARGVGATWMACLDDTWRWLFKKNYQGRFVSRTEDMVDNTGDSDSYFWKLDYIIDGLPTWLVPNGYSTRRGPGSFRSHMKMVNPSTHAAIIGEATTTGIGVGRRASRYTIDEMARLAGARGIWGQLDETTNHRLGISTHNIDVNTDYWDMCQGINGWEGKQPLIFAMTWQSVPGRDEDWLERTRQNMTYEMFQREVMMNPHAGISSWVYPQAKLIKPIDIGWQPMAGMGITSMDDGWDDEFACIWAQWDRGAKKLVVLDGYKSSHKPLSYYGLLLKGMAQNGQPWDSEALRLMAWINRWQLWKNIHVGDRHGDNTDLTSGVSPWMKMQQEFGIVVQPSSSIHNDHKSRRDALGDMLQQIDFASTLGAHAVLESIQNNRFPQDKTDSNFAREHRAPIHDQTSHFTTALEYMAIYVLEHFVGRIYSLGESPTRRATNNNWLSPKTTVRGRRGPKQPGKGVNNEWIR